MKTKNLSATPRQESGDGPDRRMLTLRLPVPLAARLEALCEIHPDKSRSELIEDVLSLGLEQIERAAAQAHPDAQFHPDTSKHIYLLNGPFSEFHGLTYKHHLALEREQEKDYLEPPYPADAYQLGDAE